MKKILLFTTGILLLLSIPVTVFFIGQQQEMRKKAAPATTLSLSPSTVSASPGDTLSFNVEINTGENQVATAQLAFVFDQTKAEALSVTSGPQAPRILTQGITGAGAASITVGAESTVKPITGTGIIAVIRLKILPDASGPFTLQFAPTTFVGGLGEKNPNVLVSKTNAQITLPILSTPSGNTTTGGTSSFGSTTTTPLETTITPTPTSIQKPENLTSEIATTSGGLTVSVATNAATAKPVIKGTAPPGSTVTIIIHSETQTVVVTADANGNYQYIPTSLEDGSHTVVVTSEDQTGQTQTTSSSFTVGENSTTMLDPIPETGSTLPAIILGIMGIILLGGGAGVAYVNMKE